MKKVVIILSLITALLCLNISRSEADLVSSAVYKVTMTVNGGSVTPIQDGNSYTYGTVLPYTHQNNLWVYFNANPLGGATSLSVSGDILSWQGTFSAQGVEDYYFRLISKYPYLTDKIITRLVPLKITYYAYVATNGLYDTTMVQAQMAIIPPPGTSNTTEIIFDLSNAPGKNTLAQGVTSVSAKLGETWSIHLFGFGLTDFTPTANSYVSFRSFIDPTIVVDPESYVFIDADKYFDKDLFSVEFSPNLAVPVPGALWLFGSGLLGLVGWRRFRKS